MKTLLAIGILSLSSVLGSAYFTEKVSASQPSSPQASTTVVISQAYGGGGGASGTYMNDYVELKNISSAPQSLNGLSLMYGSSGGQFGSSATNIFALPNTTLQPGQYFLVQLSSAGSGGAALPVTPDAVTTNLSMSGSSGKVALVTAAFTGNTCGATATPCSLPNANIIDLVSYGAANNAEGGAPTNGGAALTATQGNVRKGNGCQDTDNNNADFDVVTAPVPHNSSTTTACSAVVPHDAAVDFNGDGKTDYTIVRNTGGGAGGQVTWFYNLNGSSTTAGVEWGIATDFFIPEDFDGDGKDDVAVWRGTSAIPAFYILQSADNTVRTDDFGQAGDDPRVVGDYDGDGKADVAVYRGGAAAGDQSVWYFRGSLTPDHTSTRLWGQNGDFPMPGDYDGDGKNDFCVQRGVSGQGTFWTLLATGTVQPPIYFGLPSDLISTADYDGDGKTDLAAVRGVGGAYQWWIRSSQSGNVSAITWGASATDFAAPGDYDGDGKTDVAIWRPSATAGQSAFWAYGSQSGNVIVSAWGQNGDYPPARSNVH
jgi:hypothetical protein